MMYLYVPKMFLKFAKYSSLIRIDYENYYFILIFVSFCIASLCERTYFQSLTHNSQSGIESN